MQYDEQIFSLRRYSRSVGGPEVTLEMLEFLEKNKDDMPDDYREMFDNVMDGMRQLLEPLEQVLWPK
jgi:hypothetical protein